MALRKNRPHRKNRLHHNNSNRTKREWNNRVYGRQNWDTTKNSHRDTQDLKTKTHREKRERERERERKRERDFAPSFPVTAGPPGPKYTATDTCTEGSFGRSPLCKGTCGNKFGPVRQGKSLGLGISLSQKPGQQVASQGLSGRLFLSTAVFPWSTAKEAP